MLDSGIHRWEFALPSLRRALHTLLCTLAFLACAGPAAALEPALAITQYSLKAWQTDQGLPQNSVFAVTQTQDGYLWLATQEGLVRFDGVRFTVFNQQNTEQIKNNDVWTLLEDRKGSLWIGIRGGGLARLKGGTFVNYSVAQGLSNDSVQSLFESRDGSLWIGTRGGGLNHLRGTRFEVLTTKEGLAGDTVYAVLEDRAGVVWAGTDGKGLSRYENGRFTTLTTADGLASDTIYTLMEDATGALWIGTGAGLNRLKDGQMTRFTTADGLSNNNIRKITQDAAGNLWVGTDGGGLNRYSAGRFTALTSKQGLSGDNVGAIYEDREGSLWVGSDTGGLSRLRNGSFASFSSLEGLSNDNARSILETRDGTVWIGTFGGLNRYANGEFSAFTSKDGLSADVVLSLAEAGDGSLWIGTLGGGLSRYHEGKFSRYGKAEGLSNETVLALHAAADGSVWIGTRSGGLNRYAEGKFSVFTTAEGLASNDVRVIAEDPDGSLWIGTLGGGLSHYQGGRFSNFTTRDGLSSDKVLSLHRGSDGALWIGTFGSGLTRYRDGKFTAITSRQGLYDDAVFQILEDASGNLWMSGNRGVHRVSLQMLNEFADGKRTRIESTSYGKTDGMRSVECNGAHQPAGMKDRMGRLWFPTIQGVTRVAPSGLPHNALPPPVVIESLLVNDQPQPLSANLHLAPGRNKLEFHYTGLSFAAPEKVRFRYRLEGFDRQWVEAGSNRVAYYTNIPPGSYRFTVMAANNDGVWSTQGGSFGFTLRPQFWQHPAFALVYVLMAAALVWLGLRINHVRVRHLMAREAQLLALVNARDQAQADLRTVNATLEQRAAELASTSAELEKFAYIASHDLREPLRAVVSFTQLLSLRYGGRLDATADSYIGFAVEGAFAMRRTIDNLLAYLNISRGQHERSSTPLEAAFDEARANLAPTLASSGARLTRDPLPVLAAHTQEMVVLLENLIANALKFQRSDVVPVIHLSARHDASEWRFALQDNGIGIAPQYHEQIFELFQRLHGKEDYPGTGVGLAICRKIVEGHGGRIWVESVLGQGSRFLFTLPD